MTEREEAAENNSSTATSSWENPMTVITEATERDSIIDAAEATEMYNTTKVMEGEVLDSRYAIEPTCPELYPTNDAINRVYRRCCKNILPEEHNLIKNYAEKYYLKSMKTI